LQRGVERCRVERLGEREALVMIVGSSVRAVDSKGRIILPREFRRDFEGGLMVTKGLDDCLYLLPMKEWERLVAKIEEMPSGSESTRRFSRVFFASASHLVPDGQGRILIPPRLREMAGLSKEVVIVGLSNKAEVWDPQTWQKYEAESAGHYEQSASDIGV
jgi:MraZ protein